MLDWLKGISDTSAYVRAYLTILIERGPIIFVGILLILIGVYIFVAGNKQVQGAVTTVVGVAAKGAKAVK